MKEDSSLAYSEIYEILKLIEDEYVNKIPKKIINFFEVERDKEYNANIKEPLEQQKLKNETIIILGLIYRDFLCSPEERKRLQEKDARELREVEKALEYELREKYNPDNIFVKKNKIENTNIQPKVENSLIDTKSEKWYKKILNLIKSLFK